MLALEDEGTVIETSEATTQIHSVRSQNTSIFHTHITSCGSLRHSSRRPFHATAGSVALAAIPICRVLGYTHFNSTILPLILGFYYLLLLLFYSSHFKKTLLSFGSRNRVYYTFKKFGKPSEFIGNGSHRLSDKIMFLHVRSQKCMA
jgi:hypothetical protein